MIGSSFNPKGIILKFIPKSARPLLRQIWRMGQTSYYYFTVRKKFLSSTIDDIICNNSLNYGDLANLEICDSELFLKIRDQIIDKNLTALKRKNKIAVGFLVFSSSMWNCGEIYRLFENDDRFEPMIFVRPEYAKREKIEEELYNATVNFFKNHNYTVVGLKDETELYEMPDILFHQQPYGDSSILGIQHLPLSTLNIYIPYSISVDFEQGDRYHTLGYKLSWKVFCASNYDLKLYKEYAKHSSNGMYLGYPKMDVFYTEELAENPWKTDENSDSQNVKKIIYAPHHSIGENSIHFSTFADNYNGIYEYALSHPSTTSWIIKPHPALKYQSIMNGIFEDEAAYDTYMEKWDSLPNARAVTDGTYFDIFKTSDGMIGDSVSFLSEYQFTGKPLLFLTRPEQRFTPYGEELIKILYKSPGSDISAIEEFIEKILVNDNDYMKNERDNFFKKYLDYMSDGNAVSASKAIYQYIKSAVC